MARAAAVLYAAAPTLGLVWLALPHRPANAVAILTAAGLAYCVATALLLFGERLSLRGYETLTALATLLIGAGILANEGRSAGVSALFFVWVAIYATYFLPRRRAALQVGFVALVDAGVLLIQQTSTTQAGPFVITVGTVAITSLLVGYQRQRIGSLIGRLANAARTDALTGLANRSRFQEQLELELERARRRGGTVRLVAGDIDDFARLNRRFGAYAGDAALEHVARALQRDRRRIDWAARIGGQEFAVVLPDAGSHEAFVVAERLRAGVRETFQGKPVPLTISFGVATFPEQSETPEDLLRRACQALSAAKELGRDRSVIYSDEVEAILAQGRDGAGAELQLATVLLLAEALDVRDTGTARHSRMVGRYAEMMARELSLAPAVIERVRLAGILHDIGKIGISDTILGKPVGLSEEEWVEMRRHPEIGAGLLGAEGFEDLRSWILSHHERPDGGGYPRGLEGDRIPLEARILAVADAYEAMTRDRPYRLALSPQEARAELRRFAGTQFDSGVVEAFLRALESEPPDPELCMERTVAQRATIASPPGPLREGPGPERLA